MRIVHVEDLFLPDAGYQINILPKYQVKQGHEVYIVTASAEFNDSPNKQFFGNTNWEERDQVYTTCNEVKILRFPVARKKKLLGRIVQSRALFDGVKQLQPDVVYVHGNDTLTAMRFLWKAKKLKLPLVMDSHMVDMASHNRFASLFHALYRKLFTPIIIKYNIPVIRTQNSTYVERELGIPLSQSPWVSVGSDTLLFHPVTVEEKSRLRQKHHVPQDAFVVVFSGKLDAYRGATLMANAFRKINEIYTGRKIILVTVGSAVDDEGKAAVSEFEKLSGTVIMFPTQRYVDLAEFYQMADVATFPKLCSLSFYDAQACALPIIAEDNDISTDRLRFGNGITYRRDDLDDYIEAILKFESLTKEDYTRYAENAFRITTERYNYAILAQQYTDIIEQHVREHKMRV